MHTNHRRKAGSHNPRKGRGWTWSSPRSTSFATEKKIRSRCRRRKEHLMIIAEKYDELYWKVTRSILWDYW